MAEIVKLKVLDKDGIHRTLKRITHEILEKNHGADNIVVVGIKTRGVPLAKRIAKMLEEIELKPIPVGELDITLYRDDLSELAEYPIVRSTEIPFDITKKRIILVDDVLYTGRTVRAALDALVDLGRPENIQLAVLIDRGHKQLPIQARFVGKKIATAKKEVVHVLLNEIDGTEEVNVSEEENSKALK